MGEREKFDIIIFLGRPAAGKSEVIDFFKHIKLKKRLKKYHIGNIVEIDDFKFLWARGEKDDAREKRGKERIDTKKIKIGGYAVKSKDIYRKLINDINKEFKKNYNSENFFNENTLFIEFSRGGKNAYKNALKLLDKKILNKSVIYYIYADYEEVLRKNKRRYDPSQPDSILHHIVPFSVMRQYKIDDFEELLKKDKVSSIEINKINIPYAIFNNMPEKTDNPKKIKKELKTSIDKLFELYKNRNKI